MELVDFIVKAKKNTYASGNKASILEDGFEEFVFKEGDFKYRDRYYAENPRFFGGQEVIWQKGKTAWIMNYYGFIIDLGVDIERVYEFLRKAMVQVDKDRLFRGPSFFKEGDFRYFDKSNGDVNRFKGIEEIVFQNRGVYKLEYHGGKV